MQNSSSATRPYVDINWEAFYALSRIEGEHLYTLIWFLLAVIGIGSLCCLCFWVRVWRVSTGTTRIPTPDSVEKELRGLLKTGNGRRV